MTQKKKIINIILITIILVLTIILSIYFIDRWKNEKIRNQMLEETISTINKLENTTNQTQENLEADIIDIPTEEELEENEDTIDNYTTIGILEIPSLNIKYPIISETTYDALKISVTKYWGGNPNEVGNLVILGHNYRNSSMLSKLQKIKLGDQIKITDMTGKTLVYKVYETKVIDPYNTDCTSQMTNGNIEVTVITCTDDAENRFYAKARVE